MAPNFMVVVGTGGDSAELQEWDPKKVKDALHPWTKGAQDTDHGNQEFFMLSPVDECKKSLPTRYHIYVHDFGDANTHIDDETEFYEAMVFATRLMAREGRVWVKSIWEEYKDNQDSIEQYPLLHPIGFKSPVFCAFKVGGFIYGYTLNEDDNGHYSVKKKHQGHLFRRLKMRALYLKQITSNAKQSFRDRKVDGLKELVFKTGGFKDFSGIDDITVDSLKGIIDAAEKRSYK